MVKLSLENIMFKFFIAFFILSINAFSRTYLEEKNKKKPSVKISKSKKREELRLKIEKKNLIFIKKQVNQLKAKSYEHIDFDLDVSKTL